MKTFMAIITTAILMLNASTSFAKPPIDPYCEKIEKGQVVIDHLWYGNQCLDMEIISINKNAKNYNYKVIVKIISTNYSNSNETLINMSCDQANSRFNEQAGNCSK